MPSRNYYHFTSSPQIGKAGNCVLAQLLVDGVAVTDFKATDHPETATSRARSCADALNHYDTEIKP